MLQFRLNIKRNREQCFVTTHCAETNIIIKNITSTINQTYRNTRFLVNYLPYYDYHSRCDRNTLILCEDFNKACTKKNNKKLVRIYKIGTF